MFLCDLDDAVKKTDLGPCFLNTLQQCLLGFSQKVRINGLRPIYRGVLVGGFSPFEKYESKWESSPNRGENKKYLKPPPRVVIHLQNTMDIPASWSHGGEKKNASSHRIRNNIGMEHA